MEYPYPPPHHQRTLHQQPAALQTLPMGATYGHIDRRFPTATVQWVQASHAPCEQLPLHSHESAYVCLNLGADFLEVIASHGERAMRSGMVAAHPQGAAHANRFGAQGGACLSVFAGDTRDRVWARALADRKLLPAAGTVRVLQALADVRPAPQAPDAADLLVIEEEIQDLLHTLAFAHAGAAEDGLGVARALQALRDAYAEPWTLVALAQAAGRHPTHLARQVLAVTGLRLGDHLRRRRVARALHALRHGSQTVAEVAQACGFADQAHLNRWMKRLTGLTPGMVRAERTGSVKAKPVHER